jgi:hypothetical protein
MASSSVALVTLLVASCAALAAATSYTVGDGKGWVVGVDYSGWTSGKSFAVGDKLGERARSASASWRQHY